MSVQRDAVLIYRSFITATEEMTDKQRLAYYDALIEYGLNGKLPDKPLIKGIKAPLMIAMPIIDSNCKKRENGKLGGKPKTGDLPITKEEFIALEEIPEEYLVFDFPKSWREARHKRMLDEHRQKIRTLGIVDVQP